MAAVHDWKYVDPRRKDPSRKGMLLSNEIEMFRQKNLLIADHYEPKNLRPAAYTLRIGPRFVDSRGRIGLLDDKKETYLKMEPNSIVYVSTLEKLDLPYYIAARFNLRVKWVYRGILLGTGPQVEPGFRGYLSCPLYNLTDRPIKISYRQDFATIDFERTTDFCKDATAEQIQNGLKKEGDFDSIEWGGEKYLAFSQAEYAPLKLLPDHDVLSSLFELAQEVRTWRNIGIGFAVSFFALTLTLLSFGANAYRQVADVGNQIRDTQKDVRLLQDAMKDLNTQFASVNKKFEDMKTEFTNLGKEVQALKTNLGRARAGKP